MDILQLCKFIIKFIVTTSESMEKNTPMATYKVPLYCQREGNAFIKVNIGNIK